MLFCVFLVWVLFSFSRCVDDIKREKRFFHTLNTYFTKTVLESSTSSSTTTASRNVKILDPNAPCKQNCSLSSLNIATPVSYLTPPPGNFPVTQNYLPIGNKIQGSTVSNQHDGYYYTTARSLTSGFDSLKVKLKDVMCIKSAKNGRFLVGITTSIALPATPILENANTVQNLPQCSVTTIDSTTYQLHIHEPDTINCGMFYCDSDVETNLMCLLIRFPLIPGIKTHDDALMKIECRPQQQLISQTRQFSIKPSHINSNSARSLSSVATITVGNSNPELHVQMGLFTMTKSGFTQPLGNNDFITVGDDLQLRISVRQGDGWYYSRFGQVLVHKVNSPASGYSYGENPDSIVVVADDGCLNTKMKPICPLGPFYDIANPLTSVLNMQVFTFNDMKDGDELMFSVTVFGCIHYEDCFPKNNQCQDWNSSRYKRSSPERIANVTDSTSEIRLRVFKTFRTRRMIKCSHTECVEVDIVRMKGPIFISVFIMVGVILCAMFLIYHYATVSITTKWLSN